MSQQHIEEVYEKYFNDHPENDPRCLQHKVYFDIAYFMGKRGKEGLRELKKQSFEIKQNDTGREYIELNYNPVSKKEQGNESNMSR